jgi:GxxExxY protein
MSLERLSKCIARPGLLESAYEECLCREFNLRGLTFERQVPLPVQYKGVKLDCGYRLDLIENEVILELKCGEHSYVSTMLSG